LLYYYKQLLKNINQIENNITYSDIIKYDQELRKNNEDPNPEQLAEIKNK